MPSNTLKLSQLIDLLLERQATHGDVDCVFPSFGDSAIIALDSRNINATGELFGQTLAQPVLVFGLARDEQGRLRNMPGAKYEATGDADGWTYRREAAPEGVDLAVWKRHGGHDIGKRVGDRWFVREGAAEWPPRPVEIVPAGVLAWRLP